MCPPAAQEASPMVKVLVTAAVVAFLLFYVISFPDQAANMVHDVWHVTVGAAHGIGHFFNKLSS
jgi:hypothetical protein